jgi:hypothetical protein
MATPHTPRPTGHRVPTMTLVGFMFLGYSALVSTVAKADPLESLKSFSELAPIDLRKLHEGEIRGEPGSLMSYPNGFWAETCFAVPLAPEEVASRLQLWNPSLHPTLKAIEFHQVSEPCNPADFQGLSFKLDNRPLRRLLDKSLTTTARKSDLNLSRDEARQLGEYAKGKPAPEVVAACWTNLLLQRATAFQQGGFARVAPYELSGEKVSPATCVGAMMRERPAVALEFAPLLRQSGVLGDARQMTLKAFHYWGVYEANHNGTLTLGVVYLLPLGDRFQLLDAQYYVSGTYYTSVTLYQVWPSQIGEKPGALVWRGDFFAGPTLAYLKGLERLAYGTIVLQELKKTIRCFQDDVRRPPGEGAFKLLQ